MLSAEPETVAEMERALTQGLRLPLVALRISLDSLAGQLASESVGRPLIRGLLSEVDRLGENVRGLLEYTSTVRPSPGPTSVRELVLTVRRRLSADHGARFEAALCSQDRTLYTDLPLLARCVERLVTNAFEAGTAKTLLVVRRDDTGTVLSVVDRARGGFDASEAPRAFATSKPNHLGLGLTLVARDVHALGGRFELESSPLGSTRARIFLPHAPAPVTPEESA